MTPQRIAINRATLDDIRTSLAVFETPLAARIAASETAQIIAEIDGNVTSFVANMKDLGPFSNLRSGSGQVFADRRNIFAGLKTRVAEYAEGLSTRLSEFDTEIADYDALPAWGYNLYRASSIAGLGSASPIAQVQGPTTFVDTPPAGPAYYAVRGTGRCPFTEGP